MRADRLLVCGISEWDDVLADVESDRTEERTSGGGGNPPIHELHVLNIGLPIVILQPRGQEGERSPRHLRLPRGKYASHS